MLAMLAATLVAQASAAPALLLVCGLFTVLNIPWSGCWGLGGKALGKTKVAGSFLHDFCSRNGQPAIPQSANAKIRSRARAHAAKLGAISLAASIFFRGDAVADLPIISGAWHF